jgi:hypothetical protein
MYSYKNSVLDGRSFTPSVNDLDEAINSRDDLSRLAKQAYLFIFSMSERTHNYYVNVEYLSKYLASNTTSIKRALKQLRDQGLITKDKKIIIPKLKDFDRISVDRTPETQAQSFVRSYSEKAELRTTSKPKQPTKQQPKQQTEQQSVQVHKPTSQTTSHPVMSVSVNPLPFTMNSCYMVQSVSFVNSTTLVQEQPKRNTTAQVRVGRLQRVFGWLGMDRTRHWVCCLYLLFNFERALI